MKKINIGIDVGIASVGWAVLDENYKILIHGSRLFKSTDSNGNLLSAKRRAARQQRRLFQREKTRKNDAIKLFYKFNLFQPSKIFLNLHNINNLNTIQMFKKYIAFNKNENPISIYKLRKKALNEKIDNQNLLRVLYWYLSNRGFSYEEQNENAKKEDKEKEDKEKTEHKKEIFEKIEALLNEDQKKYPVNYQLKLYDAFSYETETAIFIKLKDVINRRFSREKYKIEIEQILNVQNLSTDFKNKFLEIFARQRSFDEGPGTIKNPSKYGIYAIYKNTGKIYNSVWEKNIGNCSVYPEEKRTSKETLSYLLFSSLNIINNVSIKNHKLNKESKQKYFDSIFKWNKKKEVYEIDKLTDSKVKKLFENQIEYDEKDEKRTLLEDKKVYQEIKNNVINEILKYLSNPKLGFLEGLKSIEIFHRITLNFFDSIIIELQKSSNSIKRQTNLKNLEKNQKIFSTFFDNYSNSLEPQILIEDLIQFLSNLKLPSSSSGSLSLKIIRKSLNFLISEEKNFEEFLYIEGYKSMQKECNFEKFKTNYITTEWLEDKILSPAAKRGVKQAVNVLNALFRKCKNEKWTIENICIEMPRNTNDKKVKEFLAKINKDNKEINKKISDYVDSEKLSNATKIKFKLLQEQQNRDAYDGEIIDTKHLFQNPFNYQIDHIIPRAFSLDNSLSNKVLTKTSHNAKKKTRIPRNYLSEIQFNDMVKKWTLWNKEKNGISLQKLENLKMEKWNKEDFINRNLNDTRYIAKEFLEITNKFVKFQKNHKNNFIFQNTKVKTSTGKLTRYLWNKISNNLNIPKAENPKEKPRNWNGQHAHDAVLIVYGNTKHKIVSNILSRHSFEKDKQEKIASQNYVDQYNQLIEGLKDLSKEMNEKINEMMFSVKLDLKENAQFSNETFYKTVMIEDQRYKIDSLKLIEMTQKQSKKIFETHENFENYFIFKNNPKIWKELLEIYDNYKTQKLPFKVAIDEQHNMNSRNNILNVNYEALYLKSNNLFLRKISRIGNKMNSEFKLKENDVSNTRLDTLNWLWIDIFKFKNNKNEWKYFLVPANVLTIIFGEKLEYYNFNKNTEMMYSNEILEKGYKQEYLNIIKSKVGKQTENIFFVKRIYKNTILKNKEENKLFKIVSSDWFVNVLEMEPVDIRGSKSRVVANVLFNNNTYEIVETDILGNTYKNEKLIKIIIRK